MTLPKPAGPPVTDSFTSPEHRQAALRARGLIPPASSQYRDAHGYMIPLSEQEKVLDKKYAKEVDLQNVTVDEGESEAKRIREAWLRRNREEVVSGGESTEDGEGERVKMSESQETNEGNVTFGKLNSSRGTFVHGKPPPVSPSFAVLDTSRSPILDTTVDADLGVSPSPSSPPMDTHLVFVSPLAPPSPSDIQVLTHTPSPSLSAPSPQDKGKGKATNDVSAKSNVDVNEKVERWLRTSTPTGTSSPQQLPIPVSGSAPLEPPESESFDQIHSATGSGAQTKNARQQQREKTPQEVSTSCGVQKRKPSPITISTAPSAYSPPSLRSPSSSPSPLPSPSPLHSSLPVPGQHSESATMVDIERRQSVVSRLSANVPSLTNTGTGSEPSMSLQTPTTSVTRYPSNSSDSHSHNHGYGSGGAQRSQCTSAKPMLLGRDATVIVEAEESGTEVPSIVMSKTGMTLQVQNSAEEKPPVRKSTSFGIFGRKLGKGEVRPRRLVVFSLRSPNSSYFFLLLYLLLLSHADLRCSPTLS